MSTLPRPSDTQPSTLAEVVFHPELTAAHRLVLVARMLDPDVSVAELARKVGVDRTTATRALARGRGLGLCSSAPGVQQCTTCRAAADRRGCLA